MYISSCDHVLFVFYFLSNARQRACA